MLKIYHKRFYDGTYVRRSNVVQMKVSEPVKSFRIHVAVERRREDDTSDP